MIIIGIDPGTATTGYGVIKKTKKKLECLDYGIIKTCPKDPQEIRLNQLYNSTLRLITRYKPSILVIEKLFFFKNLKTALPVSEAKGVVLLAAAKKKIEVRELTPLEVKMGVCGYGRADKKQVQRMLKEILGLKEIPKPDDAADALGVAVCCAQASKLKQYYSSPNLLKGAGG